MKSIIVILLSFWFTLNAEAQSSPEAMQLIRSVNKRFDKVKDYTADAVIDTRISFLKILPQRAKVYYKQPNRFRLKSKGIAILPKQNLDALFSLTSNEKSYMAFSTGKEMIRGSSVISVNIVPLADTGDLVMAKVWIDAARELILRSQLTTRSNGTIVADYEHGSMADYALPDRITFTIEVKKFKIPRAVSADINSTSSPKSTNTSNSGKGNILINFSNYVLNKGIPDSIFKD